MHGWGFVLSIVTVSGAQQTIDGIAVLVDGPIIGFIGSRSV